MNCYITDLEAIPFQTGRGQVIGYKININNKTLSLLFSTRNEDWTNDQRKLAALTSDNENLIKNFLVDKKWILNSLILNNVNMKDSDDRAFDMYYLNKLLSEIAYPKTAIEKYNNLILKLFNNRHFGGEKILVSGYNPNFFYFKDRTEFQFYLHTLRQKGLIKAFNSGGDSVMEGTNIALCFLTFEGMNYLAGLTNQGALSNNCFVAMSFAEVHKYIYTEAIKDAILETGFKPVIVNEEDAAPEQSINDLIIAKIKECKFVVADFTSHKNGVYFEAGYALGRGLKVIYTCKKEDWEQTHFDTNRYQYIIWSTTEELKQALVNKINAYIKD